MRYLLACIPLFLSFATSDVNAASRYFIGAGLSSGSGTGTNTSKAVIDGIDTENSSSTYTNTGLTLKMGMKLRRAQRLELSLTQLNISAENEITVVDGDNNSELVSGTTDLPVTGLDLTYMSHWRGGYLQPYYALGAGLYVNNNKEEMYARDDIYGGAFNLAFGLLVPMGRRAELDLAVQGKAIYWQEYQIYDKEVDGFMATTVQTTSVLGSVMLGFNFIF
ncbi:MAG: hypothetical protein H7A09_01105 [Oceanospirillaceae bacterium]|nr:hypothetical protein [Oceanospirillaceae bacterium]MCP5335576.1 hypothetical protein [Oceanospirillaceae bacterium]MCP5350208.1 hypothetical protein [Oceanospirillaceae bacterium]